MRTGARCIGFEQSTAILEDGERVEADVLVGADGIASAIRQALHGKAAPVYAGYTCWRGICRDDGSLPDGSAILAVGHGMQCGIWHCGEGQIYWFVTKNAPEGTAGGKAEVLALCRNWAPPIPGVVESTPSDSIIQNDILDRPPLRKWGLGRATLLGDAAHAATPNLGQGACQALEDAVVLAHCLRAEQPVDAALRAYERLRIPRTAAIVNNSRRTGRILQLDQPALEWLRNSVSASPLGRRMERRLFRQLLFYPLPKL